jgi:hypothetical protein
MAQGLRRVLLFGPPTLLGILNLGHPILTPPISIGTSFNTCPGGEFGSQSGGSILHEP